ncbi:MAG TPA: cbb3-type cytochrome c oxidase subunit 3 [Crocinitomicaceae bacterium]|nr:cbb3-type cytochrome c oxidase subunit 3 [Crocinitomicaceae bacterium]
MLRYIKHNLTGIDGVAIYPIISLILFVLVFVAMIYYVSKMRKEDLEELSSIPFEDDVEKEELQNN